MQADRDNETGAEPPTRRRIGEVAERLGTTPRTLRFYEEQGLVRPARTAGGARRYDETDVERFRLILRLADVGLSLQEIREIARARPESRTGDQASHRVYAAVEGLEGQVYRRLQECRAALEDITRFKGEVIACFGCERRPDPEGCAGCPVYTRLEQADLFRLATALERGGAEAD